MATKAELEAELAELRKQIAQRDAPDEGAENSAPTMLSDYMSSHGFDAKDIAELWEQLSKELGHLPQNKPLLTALGVFALGVMLGRMSKH